LKQFVGSFTMPWEDIDPKQELLPSNLQALWHNQDFRNDFFKCL